MIMRSEEKRRACLRGRPLAWHLLACPGFAEAPGSRAVAAASAVAGHVRRVTSRALAVGGYNEQVALGACFGVPSSGIERLDVDRSPVDKCIHLTFTQVLTGGALDGSNRRSGSNCRSSFAQVCLDHPGRNPGAMRGEPSTVVQRCRLGRPRSVGSGLG